MTILPTWKTVFLESSLGRRGGENAWYAFWLIAYLAGVFFIAPQSLLVPNLLAILLAVTVAGPEFAVGASLWSVSAMLAYRFPRAFVVIAAVSWAMLWWLDRRRGRAGGGGTATDAAPLAGAPQADPIG